MDLESVMLSKEPVSKDHTLHESIYIKFLIGQNYSDGKQIRFLGVTYCEEKRGTT